MTVLRRLDGISYWVIEDPGESFELVDVNLRAEWESDSRDVGKDPKEDEWLRNLAARRWRLETVKIYEIKLNQELMGYSDARTGYDFAKRLRERSEELRREIEVDGRISRR